MKNYLISSLCAVAMLWGLEVQTVSAHGKVPNLQKYCNGVYKMGKRKITSKFDHVDYYYDKKSRTWNCRISYPHFSAGREVKSRYLNPTDVCRKQQGTKKVHYHKGIKVTSVQSIHCGITSGTVTSTAGKKTMINFCNKSNESNIYAAFAYWVPGSANSQKGWTSRGWFKIARGGCREVQVSNRDYNADIYIYAEGGGSVWGGDAARFCVHNSDAFSIPKADVASCAHKPYKRVRTTKYYVKVGHNNYNFLE